MSRNPEIFPVDIWPSKVKPHTVTFVRHGEKSGEGFMADLTMNGRRDSRNAGSRITSRVDLFLSSPSPRTISTAECIRDGNGSSADVIPEEQLAEPGLGQYVDFRYAMKSFFTQINEDIKNAGAEVVIATTHDYVVKYVAQVFGSPIINAGYLCGIVVNLEDVDQLCELL